MDSRDCNIMVELSEVDQRLAASNSCRLSDCADLDTCNGLTLKDVISPCLACERGRSMWTPMAGTVVTKMKMFFILPARTLLMRPLLLLMFCFLVSLPTSWAADVYTNTWAVHIDGGPEVADYIANKHGFINLGKIFSDDNYYHLRHQHVHKRSLSASHHHHHKLVREPKVRWVQQQIAKRRVKRDFVSANDPAKFRDPAWPDQWYLDRGNGLDMNVKEAWRLGYTGKGVVVTILDDGIEYTHPDLQYNYDPLAGYDVNDEDPDPIPRYDYTNENKHGTRCAGEVAAQANNNICSVGAAYNASIGGVRMLDGEVTDAVEALSLSLNPQHIDIYSASWGPDDDGRTVDGPADMARKSFYDGVTKGRGGLGSIFVWASGNGGRMQDSCNCDGYTNSMYTLSISSATESGQVPWYSEPCSSTLATTYSSGAIGERQIVTTDLRHSCTQRHTGTSASAPLAAAIVALALEANPRLTWRDMQHIVVRSANPDNLNAPDWVTTGAGMKVSHSFGFGLMDGGAMVKLAANWSTVPEQHHCEITHPNAARIIPALGSVLLSVYLDGCVGTRNMVGHLEHVFSKVTISAPRRGVIHIYLTSPAGTTSTLLPKRPRDVSNQGFRNWSFMTTHSWGESPRGNWSLRIVNDGPVENKLHEWGVYLYGTSSPPQSHHLPPSSLSKQQQPPALHPGPASQTSSHHPSQGAPQDKQPHERDGCADYVTRNKGSRQCKACKPGYFLHHHTCLTHCPLHTYHSHHPAAACLPCVSGCAVCEGPELIDCQALAAYHWGRRVRVHMFSPWLVVAAVALAALLIYLATFTALQWRDGECGRRERRRRTDGFTHLPLTALDSDSDGIAPTV